MFYQWRVASVLLYAVVRWGSSTNERNIHLLCGGAEAAASEQRTLSRLRSIMDNTNHQKRSTFSNGGWAEEGHRELSARARDGPLKHYICWTLE